MTRENKLALVVGFGLILLVGILVSDHFSTARQQEAAELGAVIDPLASARAENPDLIALRTERAADPAAESAAPPAVTLETPGDVQPVNPLARSGIENSTASAAGGSSTAPANWQGANVAAAPALEFTVVADPDPVHVVGKGESLTGICRRHYGDAKLIRELARYNGINDPDTLKSGAKLRIPPAERLGGAAKRKPSNPSMTGTAQTARVAGGTPAAPAATTSNAPTNASRSYTVRAGDSLSGIAATLLGSAGKYESIYELNKDVLATPDDIRAGMQLRIPPR
jgi:nucleoid-associated protein YgaU